MTKIEQARLVSWRSKFLQHVTDESRTVAQTCRYFGISRKTYYKWKGRYAAHGEATESGLCDRPGRRSGHRGRSFSATSPATAEASGNLYMPTRISFRGR